MGHPLGIQPWGNCLFNHGHDARSQGPPETRHSSIAGGNTSNVLFAGLGLLGYLSDELLLEILSELPAKVISHLSCCSKALYCFCSHEDLWKGFALEAGGFLWHGSWKHTFIAQQCSNISPPHQARIKASGFYSDLLYQPWFCATVDISEEWLEVDNIDRRPGLTVEEFRQHYDAKNRPVLIPGGVAGWPAVGKWTHQYLADAFQGKDVIVGNMPMSFNEYLKYLIDNRDEMPLYLFDKDFTATAPHMAEDYCVPDCFNEDLFSVLGKERPDYRWLIMGPPRSGSSFHVDPNATSAWNAVVTGSKKWILYPPQHPPPGVHPSEDGADVATPISLTEWFLNYYSATKEGLRPIECVARAGDVVFIPSGWWHLVINLEESLAVTQNFVSSATLPKVLRFLRSKNSDLVSGCAMHGRATLYDRFVGCLQEQRPETWERYQQVEAARQEQHREASRLSALFRAQPSAAACGISSHDGRTPQPSGCGGKSSAANGAQHGSAEQSGCSAGLHPQPDATAKASAFSFNFHVGGSSEGGDSSAMHPPKAAEPQTKFSFNFSIAGS